MAGGEVRVAGDHLRARVAQEMGDGAVRMARHGEIGGKRVSPVVPPGVRHA